jgi:8-oxo-dGTP pyrophosphatase MutT (NUDIX family)
MSASLVPKTVISIAAALLIDGRGCTLLVRKRGTRFFMQPGGKIECGEPAVMALARELEEELGLILNPAKFRYLGRFAALAANEPGAVVEAELFRVTVTDDIVQGAEIEQIAWIMPDREQDLALAPLTRDHVLPLWRASANETAAALGAARPP